MTGRLAILLRAVNVGGAGKLAMADLKAVLETLGCAEPQTLGAAGSAIAMTAAQPTVLETELATALGTRLGLSTEVLVRGHAELAAVRAGNPFTRMAAEDPSRLIVFFLKAEPEAAALAALDDVLSGPEQIAPGPRSLYVTYPAGQGTSKLTGAVLERALGLKGTARNWNTVGKLAALTAP